MIDKGYCLDWNYLISKSFNNLFVGENIFLSKLDKLNIQNCLDIGSNIGDFSKEILKNKNTNVVAFEPIPICFPFLDLLHKDYGNRFVYFKYALSNKESFTNINYSKNSPDLASLETKINKIEFIKKKNTNKLKIRIKKLDTFINNKYLKAIDFIKIDVEGHELKVLEGGINFINTNKVKILQVEFNYHHLFLNITVFKFSEILENYIVTQLNLTSGKLVVVNEKDFFSNIFQLSNFIFIRKNFFKKKKHILIE